MITAAEIILEPDESLPSESEPKATEDVDLESMEPRIEGNIDSHHSEVLLDADKTSIDEEEETMTLEEI